MADKLKDCNSIEAAGRLHVRLHSRYNMAEKESESAGDLWL